LFTRDINLWWRRGRKFRNHPGERGLICFEPGPGGRVFESIADDSDERVIEIGRIRVWDPPHRLLFDWRNVNFAPGEQTTVEVSFEATASGTRVTVVHSGWSALRIDHPARHRLDGSALARMIGLWWGDQMTSLRGLAADRNKQR
jgi:uncharacterized protein YndB with AHSA1/START domain